MNRNSSREQERESIIDAFFILIDKYLFRESMKIIIILTNLSFMSKVLLSYLATNRN